MSESSGRLRRAALAFAAFALGLAITALALRALALHSASPSDGALEHLAAKGRDYDVLVVGPSFVQRHFLPPVFDARMKELGHPVRSFGFGMSALRSGELDYYLTRILRLDLPKLRHVLIDVSLDQRPAFDKDNLFKRRVIYWHDPAQLLFMQRAVGAPAARLWIHAQHALLKAGNVGEGVEAVRQGVLFGRAPQVPERSAFYPSATEDAAQLEASTRYVKEHGPDHLRDADLLGRMRKKRKPPKRDGTVALHWRDRIEASGREALFVLSPLRTDRRFAPAPPGAPPLRMLDLDDPDRYPELYDPSLRVDPSHLRYQGAILISRRLAEAFAAELEAHPRPAKAR